MCRKIVKYLVPIFMLLVSMTIAQTEPEPPSNTTTTRRPTRPPTTRAPTTASRTSTQRPTPPPITVIRPPFPSSTRPPFITIRPPSLCPAPNTCTRKSPTICGRNTEGMCHRFDSICELQLTNCDSRNPLHAWRRVPMMQCRLLRASAIGRCNIYRPRCPRPLPRCPRPTRRGLCVISRNRRMCRLVGNHCQLRNLNCVSGPQQTWRVTNAVSCRGMRMGGRPAVCVRRRG